jgi:hypothetical protein
LSLQIVPLEWQHYFFSPIENVKLQPAMLIRRSPGLANKSMDKVIKSDSMV